MISRREFLRNTALVTLGSMIPLNSMMSNPNNLQLLGIIDSINRSNNIDNAYSTISSLKEFQKNIVDDLNPLKQLQEKIEYISNPFRNIQDDINYLR